MIRHFQARKVVFKEKIRHILEGFIPYVRYDKVDDTKLLEMESSFFVFVLGCPIFHM